MFLYISVSAYLSRKQLVKARQTRMSRRKRDHWPRISRRVKDVLITVAEVFISISVCLSSTSSTKRVVCETVTYLIMDHRNLRQRRSGFCDPQITLHIRVNNEPKPQSSVDDLFLWSWRSVSVELEVLGVCFCEADRRIRLNPITRIILSRTEKLT